MSIKKKSSSSSFHGKDAKKILSKIDAEYDYGPIQKLNYFNGSHPVIMKSWIDKFNWSSKLQYTGNKKGSRSPYKHEKIKYRILTFLENTFLKGNVIGGFKNYNIINGS